MLQVLLQSGRLKVSQKLPLAKVLAKELAAFRVKITAAGNETFGNLWRESPHDDLVLALALACWVGERYPALGPDSLGTASDTLTPGHATAPRGAFGAVPGAFTRGKW